jgi:AcrR family transcriptional regulator
MVMTSVQDILDLKRQVIQASLDLAKDVNWADITMADIAQEAKIESSILTALFEDKSTILSAYARQIDLRLEDEFKGQGGDESTRDRLFDIVMERFDILNENRLSIISILNAITLQPYEALSSLPFLCRSSETMLGLAGYKTNGWKGCALITAFAIGYIKILRDWVNDDTPDMAATMASVDKALNYFDKLGNM